MIYGKILLAYDQEIAQICKQLDGWLKSKISALYARSLQAKETKVIGGALYLHNNMNFTTLCKHKCRNASTLGFRDGTTLSFLDPDRNSDQTMLPHVPFILNVPWKTSRMLSPNSNSCTQQHEHKLQDAKPSFHLGLRCELSRNIVRSLDQ